MAKKNSILKQVNVGIDREYFSQFYVCVCACAKQNNCCYTYINMGICEYMNIYS